MVAREADDNLTPSAAYIGVGFLGMLVIVRPGSASFHARVEMDAP